MPSELYKEYSKIVFFDCETTGFDPIKDQIIEIAALVCYGAEATPMEHDCYMQLEHAEELPQKITDLTGILPLNLASGITEKTFREWFSEWCDPGPKGKTLLVAHNAQFDLNFVARTFMRGIDKENPDTSLIHNFAAADYLDTLTVYKDRAGYPHKLQSAIDHYHLGDKVQNTHRAIDDTKALKAVFDAMAEERDDLTEYVNLFGFNERYGVSGSLFKKVHYYRQDFGFGIKPPEKTLPELWKALGLFGQVDYAMDLRTKRKKEAKT